MRKAVEEGPAVVSLERLQKQWLEVEIVGQTPYIPHKWSEKSKSLMPGHPDAPNLKTKKGKREPEIEASACVYRLPDGRPGIPAVSLKAAMVSACRHFTGLTMVTAKVLFRVLGEADDAEGNALIPFESDTPILREDTPRNATGTADLRYRYAFPNWKARVKVQFISSGIDAQSIISLLDAVGEGGIGDWRPSAPKSATGTFGTFRVVDQPETKGEVR